MSSPASLASPESEAALPSPSRVVSAPFSATERLLQVAEELSMARELRDVLSVVRRAARELTGADGATFVLREAEFCFYAEENAIGPLWKGRRFPISDCISGWVMLHKEAVVIEDIYADARIPRDVYRPTFVKSLAMVPIRSSTPVGAIGNYWAERHVATPGEVKLLGALADLTSVALKNVELYAELERRVVEAQDAVQAREDFLSVAAHELRTPLTALLLQLQRLEGLSRAPAAAEADPRLRDGAARAVASAQRLGALVDGLLDASQLAHGGIQLKLEDLDLVGVATEVLERSSAAARGAGCALELKAESALHGTWDRIRLEQVLTHLLSNALKYGRGKPIQITLERRGDRAYIEVVDHGAGIPPERLSKIFQRFGRAGPIAHSGGLGLGLYLAREVIRAHGGSIRFESKPNQGCTFSIDLPLQAGVKAGASRTIGMS